MIELIDKELARVRLEIAALQAEEQELETARAVMERLGGAQAVPDEAELLLDFGTFTSAPPSGSSELAVVATSATASATEPLTNVGALDVGAFLERENYEAPEEAAEPPVSAPEVSAPVEELPSPPAHVIPAGVRKVRPYCQQPDACPAPSRGPCRICHAKPKVETAAAGDASGTAAGEGAAAIAPAVAPSTARPTAAIRPTGAELFKRVVAAAEARGISQKQASIEIFGQASQLSPMRNNRSRGAAGKTVEKVEAWLARPSQPKPDPEPPVGPSGAELAAELDEFIERTGASKSRVSKLLFGSGTGFETLRSAKAPKPETVEKVRRFIESPPADLITAKPMKAPAPRPAAAAPPPRDPTAKPETPSLDAADRRRLAGQRHAASIRRGQEEEAARKLDAGEAPKNSFERSLMNSVEARRVEEARQADPTEQAKLALQRKGLTVYSAVVTGGRKDRFIVSGQPKELTPAELIDLAERKTGQSFRRAA